MGCAQLCKTNPGVSVRGTRAQGRNNIHLNKHYLRTGAFQRHLCAGAGQVRYSSSCPLRLSDNRIVH